MFDPKDPDSILIEEQNRLRETFNQMSDEEKNGVMKMSNMLLGVQALSLPGLSTSQLVNEAVPTALRMADPYSAALIKELAQRLSVRNLIGDEEPVEEPNPEA